MLTATLCIGNSDNKLTQAEWSNYIKDVSRFVLSHGREVYFAGFSDPRAPWQNACWVFSFNDEDVSHLRGVLKALCSNYHQDSIALILGETEFVKLEEN